MLVGGSLKNAEVVPGSAQFSNLTNFELNSQILPILRLILPGTATFELNHDGWQTCGIPLGETIVLTGGGREGNDHNDVMG